MLELEQALEKILGAVPAPKPERVPVTQAHRRVVTESILAPMDLPAFDNSSVDGYAVRAQDVAQASPQNPISLPLAGRVAAGEHFHGELPVRQCIRIFTGSPLPIGADAIVMQEDTRVDADHPHEVVFLDSAKPWENVRFRGEDVKRGAKVAEPGDILGAAQIGLLAALGVAHIDAGTRPSVALVATGSELVEPAGSDIGDSRSSSLRSSPLRPGQIYESNRAALAPLIANAGGLSTIFPIVPDEPEATRAALSQALSQCDIVVTCGGVSVGEMDFVKSAFEQLGGHLEFWKVAIKPGRPFVFGRSGNKLLFGLPGNPVSAFVTFVLLVRPALLRWQGAAHVNLASSFGILAEPLPNPGNRRHFLRVLLDAEHKVHPAGVQASHFLSSLARAHGLVDVPPQTAIPAGKVVQVLHWE
jgi:molybdopterin molybdotransferase